MKKILTVIIFCFCIIISMNAQPKYADISLNGILKSSMKDDTTNYGRNLGNYRTPSQQSIWFDANSIHKMIALIDEENSKAAHTPSDSIDGIRVYIGSSSPQNWTPDVLIFVSTKRGEIDPDNHMSGYHHIDFYNHDTTNELFHLKGVNGQWRQRLKKNVGEQLYDHCTDCDDMQDCDRNNIHYIDRNQAETMVACFKNGPMVTRSEWFDLGLIKALDSDPKHSGFRLYFAKHGPQDYNAYQDVANKDALIWVTTGRHGIWPFRKNKDYFNCLTTQAYLDEFLRNHPLLYGGGPGGQDNGELCPLNCNQ